MGSLSHGGHGNRADPPGDCRGGLLHWEMEEEATREERMTKKKWKSGDIAHHPIYGKVRIQNIRRIYAEVEGINGEELPLVRIKRLKDINEPYTWSNHGGLPRPSYFEEESS